MYTAKETSIGCYKFWWDEELTLIKDAAILSF